MSHNHEWKDVVRGYGTPPKENTPDPIVFVGYKAECECGAKMFFPDDFKLEPTEIE